MAMHESRAIAINWQFFINPKASKNDESERTPADEEEEDSPLVINTSILLARISWLCRALSPLSNFISPPHNPLKCDEKR
jgi:hypothetical protein